MNKKFPQILMIVLKTHANMEFVKTGSTVFRVIVQALVMKEIIAKKVSLLFL